MEEFQSEMLSGSEEEFRRTIRRRMGIGAVMCIALPLLPILIFLVQYSLPESVMTALFIMLCVIGFLGFLVVGYYGLGSSKLFHGMDVLRQIAPPEPFIEGKLAVLNKDPVYGIIQWGSNALFFVAFSQSERTFDKKVELPKVIWKWEYTHPIGDIKVARREDEFTIPVDRNTYYTGKGILYSLLLEQTVIVTLQKSFTAEDLTKIVDSLAQEILAYGSNSQMSNDEFE